MVRILVCHNLHPAKLAAALLVRNPPERQVDALDESGAAQARGLDFLLHVRLTAAGLATDVEV